MEDVKESGATVLQKTSFKVMLAYYPPLLIVLGLISNLIFPFRNLTILRTVVHYFLMGIVLAFIQRYVAESGLLFGRKLLRFIIILLLGGVIIIGFDKLLF